MSKPEVPQKPRNVPPPVPLRTNKPQTVNANASQPSVFPGLVTEYPMNATWLFHSPPPVEKRTVADIKQRAELIKDNLPPKLTLKSVPVLPVKPGVKTPPLTGNRPSSASSTATQDSGPGPNHPPRRDLNFTNEIKSRCSQRLTERLPPQVHYGSNVSIYEI